MKKFICGLMLAFTLLTVTGCTSSTAAGPCIGAFDDKDPTLNYKMNGWNVAMAIIFSETIIVPVLVVVDETLCPTGKKK